MITSYYNSDSGSGDENADHSAKNKLSENTAIKNVKNQSTKKIKIDIPAQPYGPELPESLKTSQQSLDQLSKKSHISHSDDKQKCDDLKDMQTTSNTAKGTLNEKNNKIDDPSNKNIQSLPVEESSSGVICLLLFNFFLKYEFSVFVNDDKRALMS